MASDTDTRIIDLLLGRDFLPQHEADLGRSGITSDQALDAGIRSLTDSKSVAALLRWERPAKVLGPCLLFTFRDAAGNLIADYARVKPDRPRTAKRGADKGKLIRYESPLGPPNRAYFPVGIAPVLSDPNVPILITEGEKKSVKATLCGFPTIGLVGVWGWQ
jgi:hypothetical protein